MLVDAKLDKRSKAYKYLQKNVELEQFSELQPRELASWASDYAKGIGADLSYGDAQYLVDRVGAHQQLLSSEIQKLALYANKITRDSIDALTDAMPQSKVFSMLEELFRGNHEKAYELYKDQRAQGEEPHKIMAMITWQLQQLVVAMYAPSRDVQTLTAAGISPYGAQKLLGLTRTMTKAQLQNYIDELTEIDLQSKTSADIESALAVYFASVAHTG